MNVTGTTEHKRYIISAGDWVFWLVHVGLTVAMWSTELHWLAWPALLTFGAGEGFSVGIHWTQGTFSWHVWRFYSGRPARLTAVIGVAICWPVSFVAALTDRWEALQWWGLGPMIGGFAVWLLIHFTTRGRYG